MKGVILAGGTGSRLYPLTAVINKHLLPVYNKPMIYYPIELLKNAGITNIIIVLGGNSVGDFIHLLGDGTHLGVSITYRFQRKADGIAGALKLVKDFVGEDNFVVCLGDNVFENHFNISDFDINKNIPTARVFLSPTTKASSFGVPTFFNNKIIYIKEKPEFPESDFAVTGLYLYDKYLWSFIDSLKVSNRNELEITDVNNWYIQNGILEYSIVNGWWHDCGSIEALSIAGQLVRNKVNESK